ncbi:hypothetical protein AALA69_03270 [Eggerthellaceae bacterium 24-137]
MAEQQLGQETGGTEVEEAKAAGDGQQAAGNGQESALEDKHGHPGISQGKYERDMRAKDDEIASLKKTIADAAKSEEAKKALEEKIEALEASQADMRTDYELKLAGCRNAKAAKALLEDHGGDVLKLKAAEPWLFQQEESKGSTGIRPGGSKRLTKEEIMAEKDPVKCRKLISENLDLWDN